MCIMNWLILLCLTPAVLGTVVDFYHTLSVKRLQPPAPISNESLFGFSTTYDLFNKRLIISAPRTNNIGDVYDCNLANNVCVAINRDIQREVSGYNHDYWLGATVKSGKNFVVACAPRYTLNHGTTNIAGMYGRCYQRRLNDPSFTTVISRSPNLGVTDWAEKQMDTLGWSLDVAKDNNIIIGGPSMYHDRGLAMIAPKYLFEEEPYGNLNFGYSVVSGYFINPTKISYAVSTTYGSYGVGQVYFYTYDKTKSKKINYQFELLTEFDETTIGSMFGAVLCAAKLNAGKGSDLLVGAPTFSNDKDSGLYNTGAVYIYGFTKMDSRPVFVTRIIGYSGASYFGSAIVSIGDLNGDMRDEIAIAAPYEGNGVVYVYSGADIFSSKSFTWLQKIESTGYKSFGYSLAVLQDYDDNGCNELAISAPDENVVMLYRCMAAITVTKLYAKFPPLKDRSKTDQVEFTFEVCLELSYPPKPQNIFAELSTEVRLQHDHASLVNKNKGDAYEFKTPLIGATSGLKGPICNPVKFILPKGKDYSTAINCQMKTTLLNNPIHMTNFDGSRVILSDKSVLNAAEPVFAAECAGNECVPILSMTTTANVKRNQPLITGSIKEGKYKISVLNTGEVAYEPCIDFQVFGANLNNQPAGCKASTTEDNKWRCDSRSPLYSNKTWELDGMTLDFGALTDRSKTVQVKVWLFNRCKDMNAYAEDEYGITLEPDYKSLHVHGYTDIGNVVKLTQDDIKEGKQFQHRYKIFNDGATNFKELDAVVELEKPDFILTEDNPVLIQQENTNKQCQNIVVNGNKITATCKVEICSKCYANVILFMKTNPDALKYDELLKQEKEVHSTLHLHGISTNASSTLRIWESFVELWMLIVAGLVGLLLIIILAVILYKCGCLQRRNKKKLQRLKNDVKRQTIRRSMMMQRASQVPDRQQVLESMEETDESFDITEDKQQSAKRDKF